MYVHDFVLVSMQIVSRLKVDADQIVSRGCWVHGTCTLALLRSYQMQVQTLKVDHLERLDRISNFTPKPNALIAVATLHLTRAKCR